MITLTDMRQQVITALDGRESEYDVNKIVDQLHANYGLIDVDDVPVGSFWRIVQENEAKRNVRDWYFTFGIGHPLFGKRYVKINGTYDAARATMVAVFGSNWAFQYDSAGAAGVARWGLTEI